MRAALSAAMSALIAIGVAWCAAHPRLAIMLMVVVSWAVAAAILLGALVVINPVAAAGDHLL